jgi:hypothetical protein
MLDLQLWVPYRYVMGKKVFFKNNLCSLSFSSAACCGALPAGNPTTNATSRTGRGAGTATATPLLRRGRPLRHAPLLTPQRTIGIRHGVRRHFVPLLHQFRRENHPLSDSACGSRPGGCGSGPVAGRLAVRRGQFVREPEVHAGGEFNDRAAVLSGGLQRPRGVQQPRPLSL